MLFRFLAWRITKVAFTVSLTLSALFLLVQFIQLEQVLLKAPAKESVLFLSVWLLHFFSYFLPSSMVVAFGWVFFDLKESKKLNVIASFGKSPLTIFIKVLLLCVPLFFSVSIVGYFIRQEDIFHLRKLFMYKYYTEMIKGIPEKGFYTVGKINIWIEKKNGEVFKGVFLKMDDNLISAEEAIFQNGELTLRNGSLVVKKDDRYYLTKFQSYKLSFSDILLLNEKEREDKLFLPVFNITLGLIFVFVVFYAVLKYIGKHTRLYYTLGLFIMIHHLVLILLRSKL
ncbi:LptF/LptG family permease [Thermocrinis sp.]